jgi:hypothetical protein
MRLAGLMRCASKPREQQIAQDTENEGPVSRHESGSARCQGTIRDGKSRLHFNEEGLANYGFVTDMLQDLKNVCMKPAEFEALFASAEGFVRMWRSRWLFRAATHRSSPAGFIASGSVRASAPTHRTAARHCRIRAVMVRSGPHFC